MDRTPAGGPGLRAVVTGASRGLGRAVCEALAHDGATVAATARTRDALDPVTAGDAGGRVRPVVMELGEPASVDAAATAMLDALGGRVDLLVNSAGTLGERGPLAEVSMDLLCETLRVNVCGTLRLTQRLLGAVPAGGAVVMVGSGAAGRAGWGGYALAKLALDGATRMLREECADRRIRFVSVNPGGLRTDMRAAAYPDEDPSGLPGPESVVGVFRALAAGADPGWRADAREWPA